MNEAILARSRRGHRVRRLRHCRDGCDRALRGQAVLKDKSGQQVGLATLTEEPDGVRIEVTGVGLPPGPKGIHIHAVGKCEPPDFASAGAHFNPAGKKHGRLNPDGSHAGDLPNLVVTPIGAAGLDATTKAVTLRAGRARLALRRGRHEPRHPCPARRREDRSHRQQRRPHRLRRHHPQLAARAVTAYACRPTAPLTRVGIWG